MSGGDRRSTRPTLTDVAKLAGVSVQTASQVLAKTPGVRIAAATRVRVEEAARTIGYQPNRVAQAMRKGRTNVVSVWMPIDRPVMTFMRALNAINKQARAAGYDMMVVGLDSAVAYGTDRRLPTPWPSDGIISYDAGRAIKVLRENAANRKTPTVIIGTEEFDEADTVTWDVMGAARRLTSMLISDGMKHIVHLTPHWVIENFPLEQRRTGYRLAMDEAGFETVIIGAGGESASDGSAAIGAYVDVNPVPEAVFAFTDTLAMGVMREFQTRGISVPSDCEVWGYGDFPEAADARIPLSTLRVPIDRLVPVAWKWLTERIDQPNLPARMETVDMDFVVRRSSRRFATE